MSPNDALGQETEPQEDKKSHSAALSQKQNHRRKRSPCGAMGQKQNHRRGKNVTQLSFAQEEKKVTQWS